MQGARRRPPLPKRPAVPAPDIAAVQGPRVRTPTFESRLGGTLLVAVHAGWLLTLACGIYLYDGTKVESAELPLHHFDLFFRKWGGVMVLGVLGIRFLAGVLLPGLYHMPEVLAPAVLYALQAGFRLALYQLHLRGLIFNPNEYGREITQAAPHVMSDHIVLAAASISGLASEAVHPLLALRRQPQPSGISVEKVFLAAHIALSLVLAALVCGESFYTARYFHPPLENLIAGVAGLLLFQAPMLLFNTKVVRALKAGGPAMTGMQAAPARQARPAPQQASERDALLDAIRDPKAPAGMFAESQG